MTPADAEKEELRQRAYALATENGTVEAMRTEWNGLWDRLYRSPAIREHAKHTKYALKTVSTRARIAFLQAVLTGATPAEARAEAEETGGVKEWLK